MNLTATILVPTHNHGSTLWASVGSALRQTVSDIEVFVIGDGVPDETRDIMAEMMRGDSRVRFFDHPKGPRHGEVYRHEALREARGRIVCYLSDDDLYLPHHVERMTELLKDADFAHTVAVAVQPDGSISTWTVDLELPVYRDELLASRNRIPFSAGGHTLSFYGQLADGWTTTPVGTPTDLYMWQKFLRHPACRFRSGRTPTVVVFPSPERGHMTAAERLQELQTWTSRIGDERAVVSLDEEILAQKVREAAELEGRMLQAAQQGGLLWRDSLLQVFFPSPAGHNENDSARFTVPFGRWHKIALAFPYPRSEVPVRIDPTLHPGLVQLAWITLYNADGSVLWQCAEQNSHQLTVAGTAIPMSIGRLVQILSTGNDPQILLPPMATPGEPQEVRLELMVRLDAGVERLVDLLSAYLQMQEPSGPAPPPP
ncbi:MAG TPA: glycosyltransferase family 2 protein [Planctomycetota bacterium]|nr:glycosyltransferase family 2 protein [Planctomycetota bacterium]